jgi:hypothetical protein
VAALAIGAAVLSAAPPARAADRETLLWIGGAASRTEGADGALLGDDSRSGFTAGGGFWWPLGGTFIVAVDVRYTEKGSEGRVDTRFDEDAATPDVILDAAAELNYIEVPLLLAAELDFGTRSAVRGYFGPSANFLVSGKVTGALDGQHFETDIAEGLAGVDWAGVVGTAYAYRLSSGSVVFDARWTISLRSIEDAADFDVEVRNSTFAFSLGWAVPIRGGGE